MSIEKQFKKIQKKVKETVKGNELWRALGA